MVQGVRSAERRCGASGLKPLPHNKMALDTVGLICCDTSFYTKIGILIMMLVHEIVLGQPLLDLHPAWLARQNNLSSLTVNE